MKPLMLAAGLVLLVGTAAAAKDKPGYSPAYDACMAKAVATYDMDDCNEGEIARRTPLLNQAFQQALARVEVRLQPQIRAAERAWIASRDADCGLYEHREQFGSFGVIQAGQCVIDRTIERTHDLKTYAEGLSGDDG